MLEPWQKEVNAEWVEQLKTTLKEDGVWMWPATGFMYRLIDGELVGINEGADQALKDILPNAE